ncbi:hypothetical protein HF521_021890 [Silurus meridionalis]|uniref:C-type lectin domain-containing protein n=2 Tax=Silurus meridionalis TaxID=175797 RepID=A0A8T0BCF5_SILME|nr:hypothetical protein HF521_021890 [Silurus meridionalis]
MSWSNAQKYCREKYVDLSTIDSLAEYESFVQQTKENKEETAWIGLSNKPNETTFTRWSDGSMLGDTEWKSEEPNSPEIENCVYTSKNQWYDQDCALSLGMFCYKWAPEMIVVQGLKNWEEALVDCRTNYTHLLSITSKTDQYAVNSMIRNIQTPTFWTGLRFIDGLWFWVNQTGKTLPSMPSCPKKPFHCGAQNVRAGVWENRDCSEKMNFICYRDI